MFDAVHFLKCEYKWHKKSSNGALRRVRDSNPRTCYSQQFSRLPQSTALPTLRVQNNSAAGDLPKKNETMANIL